MKHNESKYYNTRNRPLYGVGAALYSFGTFAATGFAPTNGLNTYTAIAQDTLNRASTNSVTVNVIGNRNYTYDANGNLTSDGARNFNYDDENELIGVWVTNAWSNSFAYDGLMRKRIEQDFAWGGSSWVETNEVHYIYDGNLVLQERDKNNNPLTTYTRGPDLSGSPEGAGGIGGLLARSDNQKIVPAILNSGSPNPQNLVTSYYFDDGNGNVTALVSPSGMILAQYEYDPFGNVISKFGMMADMNKYRFSSKEWNDNTGLYYYGYRFYDPNLQRWLNRDPIQEEGGINLYSFVANGPLDGVDSFGECDLGALAAKYPGLGLRLGASEITLGGGPEDPFADAAAGVTLLGIGYYNALVFQPRLFPNPVAYNRWAGNENAPPSSLTLPMAQRPGSTLPGRGGPPNGSLAEDRGNGNGTIRDYDKDGNAKTDYDFGHDHGQGDPHAHDWDWNQNPPRDPIGRPICTGE